MANKRRSLYEGFVVSFGMLSHSGKRKIVRSSKGGEPVRGGGGGERSWHQPLKSSMWWEIVNGRAYEN